MRLKPFADETQDEPHLVGRALGKVARTDSSLFTVVKMVGMGRKVGMVWRVVETVDLTRLPPALPVVGVLSGGA